MNELKALKFTFMSLQKTENSFRLSERTVVDIINKIEKRGKINLLHTVTGKEYVVDEKINIEILNEIKTNKIISIIKLAKNLEIPINIIEKKVNQFISKNKTLTLVENKILTEDFLNKMIIEINKELIKKGNATIAELATMFDLSINFMSQFIKQKIGLDKEIKGKLYSTRILTEDYLKMQKKKIRPVLIASITPINIGNLISKYKIDELLIFDLINSMILSREIEGVFRANEYKSETYSISQINYLKEEVKQNHYIDYSKLKNIGISQNGKEFLIQLQDSEDLFKNGVFLKDYFISETLKTNFLFLIQDNTEKEVPTNMTNAFFFVVEYDDTQILLESLGLSIDQYYYINNNLIPKSIILLCIEDCNLLLNEIATNTYKQYASKIKEKETKNEIISHKKSKKKTKEKQKIIEEERQDEIELPKISLDELELKLKKNNRFADINDKDDTVYLLFNKYILPKLKKQLNDLVVNLIKSEANIAGNANLLAVQINNDYLNLKIIQKSLELLIKMSNSEQYQNSMKAIIAYLAKKNLVNIMKDLMVYQLLHMKIKTNTMKLNTHNERNDFINIYPDEDIRNVFNTLNNFIQNRQVIEFLNFLTEKCQLLAISLDLINKMKEKAQMDFIVAKIKESVDSKIILIQQLSQKDFITLIVNMCNLAICKKGYYLYLPNENWSINLFYSIFSEPFFNYQESTSLLNQINQIISAKTFDYLTKEKELIVLAKELYNAF